MRNLWCWYSTSYSFNNITFSKCLIWHLQKKFVEGLHNFNFSLNDLEPTSLTLTFISSLPISTAPTCCESWTQSIVYAQSLLQTFAGCWEWNHTPQPDTLGRCFHVFLVHLHWRFYQTWFRQGETKVWRHDCDPEIYALSGPCWCLVVERIDLRHPHRDYPQ